MVSACLALGPGQARFVRLARSPRHCGPVCGQHCQPAERGSGKPERGHITCSGASHSTVAPGTARPAQAAQHAPPERARRRGPHPQPGEGWGRILRLAVDTR